MKQQEQSRSSKSKRTTTKQPASETQSSENGIAPEQRHQMIAETAYFMAQSRGFGGDCQLDDWLQAEAMIDRQLSGQQPS